MTDQHLILPDSVECGQCGARARVDWHTGCQRRRKKVKGRTRGWAVACDCPLPTSAFVNCPACGASERYEVVAR